MRLYTLLIIATITTSCNGKKINKDRQTNQPIKISYYKCDYSKSYDTILSSGTKDKLTEVWGADVSKIKRSTDININSLDFNNLIKVGKAHLIKRFPGIELQFSDLEIKITGSEKQTDVASRFIEITYVDKENGFYQKVPVLLDGRVVLSNNEEKM